MTGNRHHRSASFLRGTANPDYLLDEFVTAAAESLAEAGYGAIKIASSGKVEYTVMARHTAVTRPSHDRRRGWWGRR